MGDYAGLAAFQQEYGFIGVTKQNGTSYIIMELRDGEQARTELLQERVYLKIRYGLYRRSRYLLLQL